MIGYLEGTAVSDGVLLTSGGVGYAVATPGGLTTGGTYRLWCHTVVRETSITLYGFDEQDELTVFEALCGVHRVGPAVALAILRDVGVDGVVRAVRTNDPAVVAQARGVGRKVAESILAAVKLPDELLAATGVDDGEVTVDEHAEAVAALVGLGYSEAASREVVGAVAADGATHDELISMALLRLARGAAA